MSRRKSIIYTLLAVMLCAINIPSLIQAINAGGDKSVIFKAALIPGIWALLVIFWIGLYLRLPKDDTMYRGNSLKLLIGFIVETIAVSVILNVYTGATVMMMVGGIYFLSIIIMYRFYGTLWVPKNDNIPGCKK